MDYIIRDYKSSDYQQLLALWDVTGLSDPERGDDEKVIKRTLNMGGKLLVIEDIPSKKLIGSSWLTCDGRRIYIYYFGIHPDYQDKGLGTRLAAESIKHAREKGYQLKLEVHKENLKAKHLYEKFGLIAYTDFDIYMLRNVGKD